MTLANGASSTDVIIDTLGVAPGTYSVGLESFDTASSLALPSTLKTDTITIYVTEYSRDPPAATSIEMMTESLETI